MGLSGKQVLVIGGGSGIGLGIAKGAASEGAAVTIASRDAKKIAEAAKSFGGTAASIDVSEEANVAQFFKEHTGFDHIAFTAGDWEGIAPGALADLDLKKAADRLTTRFWGAVAVAKHGAAKLPPGGSYTITNGMLARKPMQGMPTVTASACAVEGLALGLAVDLAPVRVNCVCPGLIQTEMWAKFPEGYRDVLMAMSKHQLVPRPGTTAEAAEAYLTCMRNTFLTGQVICVEGGSTLAR
ncbi:MAG TPA: SDR family oxidoreductase [Rhizomicrobium sp.]|jgi:NAD(P)-dependent dehydrogenase (short-subunit alcohol dehydrogenase family)